MPPRRAPAIASLAFAVLFLPAGAPAAAAQSPIPDVIPLYPLPAAALFPNASQSLLIVEPQYKAMVADALKGPGVIGLIALVPGAAAGPGDQPAVVAIGCAGAIFAHEELPDGRISIVLAGLAKFRILAEEGGRPYRQARVMALPEVAQDDELRPLADARKRIDDLLSASRPRLDIALPPADAPDEAVVDVLALHVPMSAGDRQRLLEEVGSLARATALVRLLQQMLAAPPGGAQPR